MGQELNFSSKRLHGIAPAGGPGREVYRDRGEPGLNLYVTPRGTKTFFLVKKFEGRPLRIKIGRFPDLPVSAARAKAQQFKGQLALGVNPVEEKRGERLRDGHAEARRGEIYRHEARQALRRHHPALRRAQPDQPRPMAGQTPRIDHQTAGGGQARETGQGARPPHRGPVLPHLQRLLRVLRRPLRLHRPQPGQDAGQEPALENGREGPAQASPHREESPVWYAAVGTLGELERDYLLVLLVTGMRKTEATRMRWENVDFDSRSFTIKGTKNGEDLALPMGSFLRDLLARRLNTARAPSGQYNSSRRKP